MVNSTFPDEGLEGKLWWALRYLIKRFDISIKIDK